MAHKGNTSKDSEEQIRLKKIARTYGLKFGPRLGEAKLRKMIEDHEALMASGGSSEPVVTPVPVPEPVAVPQPTVAAQQEEHIPYNESPAVQADPLPAPRQNGKYYLTREEFHQKEVRDNKLKANRLVRCRITCMNPAKKNWTGEIVSVGSAKLGTFKKFIPYNNEEPYHVPWIIFNHLKERQCRIGTTVKLPNGREVNRYKLINEFAIEVLPPLTPGELKDLKQRQAMAQGTAA